jgi:hypothetical protein
MFQELRPVGEELYVFKFCRRERLRDGLLSFRTAVAAVPPDVSGGNAVR